MILLLGIIIGLLLALLWITLSVLLPYTPSKTIQAIEDTFKGKPQGAIYFPPDDESYSREQIIKRNQELGKDTPLDQL